MQKLELIRPGAGPPPEAAPPEIPAFEKLARALLIVSVLLALALVFFACLHPIAVTDFWWQLKTGELILRTRAIPHRDPFSWTSAGRPWLVHEWLTEVFFYLAFTHLPNWVLLLYKCGLGVVACGLVMQRAWNRSGSTGLSVLAVVGAGYALRNYADLRPQMLTFVLLAGLMSTLDRYRAGGARRLPYLLPALFLLWANLHGGVVVGLLLVSLWLLGEGAAALLLSRPWPGLRPLALGVAACVPAVAVNPNGFYVYAYPFQVLGHPEVMDYITEWFPPNFHSESMRAFEVVLLATLASLAVARPRPDEARFGEVLVLAAMAHAALISQRNTAPFALFATPVAAGAAATLWREVSLPALRDLAAHPVVRAAGALLLAAGLCLALYLQLPRVPGSNPAQSRLLPPAAWFDYGINLESFPRVAVGFMRQGCWPGKIYNDYVWGGYLIWELYPQRKVFIDGRAEVYYPTKAFEDEMAIHYAGSGWRAALDRRGVDVVLTSATGSLARVLQRDPDWQLSFRGAVEMVFTRKTPVGPS